MPTDSLTCLRCGYQWTPRTADPLTCPHPDCRSPYWRTRPGELGHGPGTHGPQSREPFRG